MYKLCELISKKLLLKNYIYITEINDIRFALEVLISQFITFSTIILVGILTGYYIETILFIGLFGSLRSLSTGFHAKYFLNCYILTNLSYLISVYFCLLINPIINNYVIYFSLIFSLILTILYFKFDYCQYLLIYYIFLISSFLLNLYNVSYNISTEISLILLISSIINRKQ